MTDSCPVRTCGQEAKDQEQVSNRPGQSLSAATTCMTDQMLLPQAALEPCFAPNPTPACHAIVPLGQHTHQEHCRGLLHCRESTMGTMSAPPVAASAAVFIRVSSMMTRDPFAASKHVPGRLPEHVQVKS